ncbi:thioredoxin domain-containing protein 11 [Nelusetta ayraudi]|uniref:thioredoxin domain-containing protein 11 n=1 Tax=Nelusetta ayraudi TaxID=303726 RepID=UPI003F725B00
MLRRVRQSLRQVLLLMARRPALLCGAIVLGALLILAVKFTCSRAKNVVASARPPVRFFPTDVPVVDLYLGQLDQVERLRSMAEVSLIFFYAPWCAHSMAARHELQQVAKKLAKQVLFVAVNCWWSQGKCRRQNRFYHFPVIHVFYRRFGPIEYKGPFVAPYLESFVLRVITPLTYLSSTATLKHFLSYHESRVVGFFQFNSSPQPPGYITYLSSALQALKRDFSGMVRFGVVTNQRVAEAVSLKEDESIYLYRRLNHSLIFPRRERNFTSEAICSWVFEHYETVLHWLQPPGTKSRLLEQELTKGPAMLVFLPHDPRVAAANSILQQVADVAVRYHSCHAGGDFRSGASSARRPPCCQSLPLPRWSGSVCEVCVSPCACYLSRGDAFQSHLRNCCLHKGAARSDGAGPAPAVSCANLRHGYSPFRQYSACCRTLEEGAAPPASRAAAAAPPSAGPLLVAEGVTGLRCRTNRTLRFYVLDVALNLPLAVRLGATRNRSTWLPREDGAAAPPPPQLQQQQLEGSDGSFATIVDLQDEVHYVLHRSPAATLTQSLEAFIRNFSSPYSLLQRHLVGEVDRKRGTEEAKQLVVDPIITELTTSSFLPCVMDIQKDVLLIYYTQWCGFCSAINHIIIQLARLLQGNPTITVARLNVARNDLPWEFMVDRVPSILLFPKYRQHFTVKFPDDERITLPNLLRFILRHSSAVRPADQSAAPGPPPVSGPASALRAEFEALQREVQTLRGARERLSQQLARLWRDNQRLKLDSRSLEARHAVLAQERKSLEERHREKSRQLLEAVGRLQELADTSENLLNENTLLRVLLRALEGGTDAGEQGEAEAEEARESRSRLTS